MSIKVSVVGATGRMGRLAISLIEDSAEFELHSALDSKSDIEQALGADLIFEATKLEASQKIVDFAINNSINIVVATSGWKKEAQQALAAKITDSAVVIVPNFSIGSTLATKFAAEAGKYFDSIEIIETHHSGKADSPSGTAIRTAELIAESRQLENLANPTVPGAGQTARGDVVSGVPIHSLRIDGISAKQEVVLGGGQEVLNISHTTNSTAAYAAGILHSLKFATVAKAW